MTIFKSIIITTLTISIFSCKPKFEIPDSETGELNATNYIAIGGAMTAGYSDGALYYNAQQNSYANLLAEQFKLIGGGEFKIPYVAQNSIGIGSTNNAPSILGNRTDCQGTISLGPLKIAPQGDLSVFANNIYASQGSFNNFGIPDVKVTDMDISGYTNPFYQRMNSAVSSSILSDAIAKNPTFFSVMLGLNDVLNYALKGGASESITPLTGSVGFGFETSINNVIDKLTANGAKGVIANIPSIKTMAYFNTITWNALKIDTTTAKNLNLYYGAIGAPFTFIEGANGFIIEDQSVPFISLRQMQEGEFVLLNVPLDSIKCYKWGSLIPIPDRYILTASEIVSLETAISNYNIVLKNIANSRGLAFVDVNALFTKIKNGYVYNGVTINANFVSGGFYSLDGLNLTPRGNALIANEFIKSINTTYSSTIPQIDATKYPGVIFP